ncbi:MAG: hypothetical protein U1E60_10900 [Reyranellaceae bacterium]
MATITVRVTNADSRRIDLDVTMIDNLASDDSELTKPLGPGEYYDYPLTDLGAGGSIEWTARSDTYPTGGPTTVSGLAQGTPVPVTAGGSAKADGNAETVIVRRA